jgi:uncharacterized protein (TIGR02118 family)
MAQMIVLYATPPNPAAWNKYYFETHVALVHKIPNLLKFEISTGPVFNMQGQSPYHLIGTLSFKDLPTLHQAMSTPEGRAAAADAGTFTPRNSQMIFFDNQTL